MKICVIGCGWIAGAMHLPSIAALKEKGADLEVCAVADVDINRAKELADKFEVPRAYGDYYEMLAKEKPDAVLCLTSVHATCKVSVDVLEAGIPLFLEKPPGVNPAEHEAMASAAAKTKTPHMVAFNRRHMPVMTRLKELAEGKISHISYEMVRRNRFENDFASTAIHAVDTTLWLAGSPVKKTEIIYKEMPALGENVANYFLYFDFESGASADIRIVVNAQESYEKATAHTPTRTLHCAAPMGIYMGGKGRVSLVENNAEVSCEAGTKFCETEFEFETNGFLKENEVFFDCLTRGERPADDIESARQSVLVCDLIRKRVNKWERN